MLHSLNALLAPAMAERATLVLNHVLSAEPVASERLRAHVGRRVQLMLEGWPSLLPSPPTLVWCITPAGLLEWTGAHAAVAEPADLVLRVDASNPALLVARRLMGDPPAVQIDGDAQLAADVNWLVQNLRWDLAGDLERLVGPLVAHALQRFGSAFAAGLRRAQQMAAAGTDGLRDRLRPRGP